MGKMSEIDLMRSERTQEKESEVAEQMRLDGFDDVQGEKKSEKSSQHKTARRLPDVELESGNGPQKANEGNKGAYVSTRRNGKDVITATSYGYDAQDEGWEDEPDV